MLNCTLAQWAVSRFYFLCCLPEPTRGNNHSSGASARGGQTHTRWQRYRDSDPVDTEPGLLPSCKGSVAREIVKSWQAPHLHWGRYKALGLLRVDYGDMISAFTGVTVTMTRSPIAG